MSLLSCIEHYQLIKELIKELRAVVPVSIVSRLVDGRLLDHLIGVDGHSGANALV